MLGCNMRQTKRVFWLPIFVTLTVTCMVMVFGNSHLCFKQSIIIEVALFVLIITGGCFLTARAKTRGKAWLRTVISIVLAIVLQNVYLDWLHSESFPDSLLSKKAREFKLQDKETKAQIIKSISTESRE